MITAAASTASSVVMTPNDDKGNYVTAINIIIRLLCPW